MCEKIRNNKNVKNNCPLQGTTAYVKIQAHYLLQEKMAYYM